MPDCGAAMVCLSFAVDKWSRALADRTQAEERSGEAERIREVSEAELVLGETHPEGRINGKNEEQRKQQRTVLLAQEAANGGPYGQAAQAAQSARVAADQAVLDYSIADQELRSE